MIETMHEIFLNRIELKEKLYLKNQIAISFGSVWFKPIYDLEKKKL